MRLRVIYMPSDAEAAAVVVAAAAAVAVAAASTTLRVLFSHTIASYSASFEQP
jgi:hypothetical protein